MKIPSAPVVLSTVPAAAPISAADLTPIPAIQGAVDVSPLVGKTVTTSGVVTAVAHLTGAYNPKSKEIIFLQDLAGDGDPHTSDAMAVRADTPFTGKVGDTFTFTGTVKEMYGMTTLVGATGGAIAGSRAVKKADLTPAVISLPADSGDAAQWMESHEGMLGSLTGALVMTPTTSYGTFTAVEEATHGVRKDYDGANQGQHIDVSSAGGVRNDVNTGDRLSSIVGPINENSGAYEVLQTNTDTTIVKGAKAPTMWGDIDGDGKITGADIATIKGRIDAPAAGPLDAADLDGNGKITPADIKVAQDRMKRDTGATAFTVANLNVENFFDTIDNPKKRDDVPAPAQHQAKLNSLAGLIANEMKSPSLIGLEEVENADVLKELVAMPQLKDAGYSFEIIPGPDLRGINTALLYRKNQGVSVANSRAMQGTTHLSNLKSAANPGDKNLFARPPLVADVTVTGADGRASSFSVMVNHFMSKYSPQGTPTEPARVEQAQFVRDLASTLRHEDPKRGVMVLGDLNDNDSSAAVKLMLDPTHSPLVGVGQTFVPKGERYSYQYRGSSELIDHIMVTKDLAAALQTAQVHHVNSDIADTPVAPGSEMSRPTDHDVLSAGFAIPAAG